MSKEDIKAAVTEALKESLPPCKCFLDEEEKQLVKDAATGGKYFKRAIILGLVFVTLGALGLKWLKPFIAK